MKSLLRNYGRQTYRYKELIVLLHGSGLNPEEYRRAADAYANVRIYRVPENWSLGACLNLGVRLSSYPLFAKFDDDDYYAPGYLSGARAAMAISGADIVGKRAHFMYLSGSGKLLLRYPSLVDRSVSLVQGATLLVKKRVFERIAFQDRTRGECVRFCADCLRAGYSIRAGDPYNFMAIRLPNAREHTWQATERQLLGRNARLVKATDVIRQITRD